LSKCLDLCVFLRSLRLCGKECHRARCAGAFCMPGSNLVLLGRRLRFRRAACLSRRLGLTLARRFRVRTRLGPVPRFGIGSRLGLTVGLGLGLALAASIPRLGAGALASGVCGVEPATLEDDPHGVDDPAHLPAAYGTLLHGVLGDWVPHLEGVALRQALILVQNQDTLSSCSRPSSVSGEQ
jgi:hypothetical protein